MNIYAFVTGVIVGVVVPPVLVWCLFRYDRAVMKRESRR